MYNKIVGIIFLCGLVSGLYAADKERLEQEKLKRLSKSVPPKKNNGKRVRAESHASVFKHADDTMLHRNSAPTRLSREKLSEKDQSYNDYSDNDRDHVVLEEEKKPCASSPSQQQKLKPKELPSKKLFFIRSDTVDEGVWRDLGGVYSAIQTVARDNSLTTSRFYTIACGMHPELLRTRADIFMLANYFLFKIALREDFKEYISSQQDNTDGKSVAAKHQFEKASRLTKCTDAIRTCLNVITHDAIQWPSVTRKENANLYWKEFLEKNNEINIAAVAHPYYSALVATFLLTYVKKRTFETRARFRELVKSDNAEKRARKNLVFIVERMREMAYFGFDLNAFDAEPLRD